jgi:hypothetical protein
MRSIEEELDHSKFKKTKKGWHILFLKLKRKKNQCYAGDHSQPRAVEHLDGDISYLETNDTLKRLGIAFHKHYRVLICLACGLAHLPADVVGHLRKKHCIKASDREASYILSTPDTLGAITNPGSLCLPASSGPPVEGLDITNGFRCSFCDYAAGSKTTMDGHFSVHRDEHSSVPMEARSRPAKVQVFWAVTNRVFFEVQPGLAKTSASSIWATYLSEEASKPPEELVAVPALRPTEVPLLLKHTQWHTLLGDRIKDRVRREALLRMATLPRKGDGPLGTLQELCFKYFKAVAKAARTANDVVLMMMESFPV